MRRIGDYEKTCFKISIGRPLDTAAMVNFDSEMFTFFLDNSLSYLCYSMCLGLFFQILLFALVTKLDYLTSYIKSNQIMFCNNNISS